MSEPWWDKPGSSGSSLGRGVRRPPERLSRFNPWAVAFVAWVIGRAVFAATMFVILMAGLLLAPFMGLAGIGDGATVNGVVIVLVMIAVAVLAFSVRFQARYITRRGGAHAWTACVTALVAGMVLGPSAAVVGLPTVLTFAAVALVEVAIAALLIEPASPHVGGYGFYR